MHDWWPYTNDPPHITVSVVVHERLERRGEIPIVPEHIDAAAKLDVS